MDVELDPDDHVVVRHGNGLREAARVIAVRRIAGGAYLRLRMTDGIEYIAPVSHIEKSGA
jgi:hypothetical protein